MEIESGLICLKILHLHGQLSVHGCEISVHIAYDALVKTFTGVVNPSALLTEQTVLSFLNEQL